MPKTIFSKLVAVFLSILLIAFIITGGMLFFFLNNFVSSEKVKLLEQSGERINSFLSLFVEHGASPLMSSVIDNVLKTYSENTNSIIWITDINGKIVFINEKYIPNQIFYKLRKKDGTLGLPDNRQYQWITKNEKGQKVQGDFFGLFEDTQVSWLTVMMPFKYSNNDGVEKVLGGIYLNTPIPELKKAQVDVFKLFLIAVITSILVSVILIYIFSLKISTPLKNLKNATKEIENGDFGKKIEVKSDDEIGELTESFNNMSYAIKNLEELRRGFIANVSHELRTPMTSIKGFIEGMLDGTIPIEHNRKYLEIVKYEVNRLHRLVDDIFVLAKVETDELTLNCKKFDINELIRICIIKLETQLTQKELEIEAEFDYEKILVFADKDAIDRVVLNILHNSIKFSKYKGKIILSVKDRKNKVFVAIEDNGIGISEEELNCIWDRFYKSDKSRSQDKDGSGLGLSIVKNIIKKHNQDIWVESELNKRTKFVFSLEKGLEEHS